jgi:hypothetical protein
LPLPSHQNYLYHTQHTTPHTSPLDTPSILAQRIWYLAFYTPLLSLFSGGIQRITTAYPTNELPPDYRALRL